MRFGRERFAPEPIVIESIVCGKPTFRIENENLVDQICEDFGVVTVEKEEEGERRVLHERFRKRNTYCAASARILRPPCFHCCWFLSIPSTPGSEFQPGIDSSVGGPQALRDESSIIDRSTEVDTAEQLTQR